jgi:predicted DNA repair protein MutK
MAGSSLLALIDDIASILDDVAAMSKVAARKTASVLGDDLALNAQQVSGVKADRELPVVWAVAKGSLLNKAILVPLALLISAFIPWAITPLLMIGGAYLCYEGFEKIAEKFFHGKEAAHEAAPHANAPKTQEELLALEKKKVKGAVRTDFILSAEIIVISLNTVAHVRFVDQVMVMVLIAVVMTVGVYGLVAGIVRMDDVGFYLRKREGNGVFTRLLRGLGTGILHTAPLLMKTLSIVGTIAMFLVGGSILTHGLPFMHSLVDVLNHGSTGFVSTLITGAVDLVVGLIAGAIVLGGVLLGKKVFGKKEKAA